jgi:hypothetical protein
MKPALSWLAFGVACVAQWAAPLASIRAREEVLERGEVVRFAVTAPDPFDPLRGRYLRVNPKESEVVLAPEVAHLTAGKKVWVQLEKGPDGLHHLGELTEKRPVSGDYLPMILRTAWNRGSDSGDKGLKFRVAWPVDRFYVNETLAPKADAWLRENTRGKQTVVAELRLLKGTAVITDLELDGRSFREILKQSGQ